MSECGSHRIADIMKVSTLLVIMAGVTSNSCSEKMIPEASSSVDIDILKKNIFDSRYIPSPLTEEAKAHENRSF